ncbi:hypothetical protein D0869_12309 [Hortaea werneckii]|uniref:Sedlin n=1 Tax=Hortaea werneckii TaxID=91943 RepID=A0A3M6W8E3_HORWE|nr:hypothetical protein D0869_12309 [Hortaea werneckii]RMX94694.1 hypothetical protein D0868_12154 [Hortaea werneckii]
METRQPSIAAIGIIGRHNNPLHISLFPSTTTNSPSSPDRPGETVPQHGRDKLEFSFMLNSSLDIFEARMPSKGIGHDFGLLHALDERIAMYGWLLNTGVKLIIVVDMEGASGKAGMGGVNGAGLGLRGGDLTPGRKLVLISGNLCQKAFQALQTAYIRLLRNPFYVPDDHDPKLAKEKRGSLQVTSPRFIKEVERIGKAWYPGISVI